MKDSITQIGESLYRVYGNKMTEWSESEFTFAAEDLFPSFRFVDDIMQMEEGWQAFATIFPNVQSDYLPQDLFIFSGGTALTAAKKFETSDSARKIENDPVAFLAEAGLINPKRDFYEQVQLQNMTGKA